jgi:glycosyltransferase
MESVQQQTYTHIQHIIVDGGSSDGTLEIAREYSDQRITVISERDHGIYDAMNKGAQKSKGDIICFLNADDYYSSPKIIENVVQRFAEDSVEVVYGDIEYVSPESPGRVTRKWESGPFRNGLFTLGWAPPHPAFFVRIHAFKKAEGFRLEYKLAADADLMMRMLEVASTKWSYIPQVMVKMRLGGATNNSLQNILRGNVEIWKSLKANGLRPKLMPFIMHKAVLKVRHALAGRSQPL